MYDSKHLQALYAGFCSTSLLWENSNGIGLNPLFITDDQPIFLRKLQRRLRLGQLAEQFLFNQLDSTSNFKILAENIQVQHGKQTIGEIDALLQHDKDTIHLEMVYKFYLYDETLGPSEIDKWIGPNRNDSLSQKLSKLKKKQFPLLYTPACKAILENYDLRVDEIKQYVLFKAQLFTPYTKIIEFGILNKTCLTGFYIFRNQIECFKDYKFYVPPKVDWLLQPHLEVIWSDMETFISKTEHLLIQKKSPLFWLKNADDELQKCFLVWW